MKKRIVSLLFTLVYLGLCLVPAVGLMLGGAARSGANEVLAVMPSLTRRDGTLNGSYLSGLADYIGDRFFLRQEFVTAWARLNATLFHSSVTEDVILGDDGWLYFAPTLADYTGSDPMSERELWCAARTLCLLQEYAEGRGGEFLFTVAPNKNSLYNDAMPAYPRSGDASNADRLFALLDGMDVNYVNLFAVFAAQNETLYFPTDSHWNGRGAALAADALLDALGRESAWFDAPFAAGEHTGDLYEMLYPAGDGREPDMVCAGAIEFTADTDNVNAVTINTAGSGEGALLMYRDSFGRNLYPYLAASFESAVFSRKNDYDPTAMADGGALIVELVERNLRYLNANVPSLPAPERDASLSDGARLAGTVSMDIRAGKDGLVTVSGTFGELAPDADSPVYLLAGDRLFEAVPTPQGFSARLSEDTVSSLAAVFTADGETVRLDNIM